ncbi:MAG: glycoside hydrolase family 15 protein [Bryobacteraceae bacterium]
MSYQPIANYGMIGDLHSAALVGRDGSIDWCCLPRFDSPSVFAAILDDQQGGFFRIAPASASEVKQIYLPETNVLLTRFLGEGMAELIDFMPVGKAEGGPTEQDSRQIVRIVRSIRGSMQLRLECRPAFDYARQHHTVHLAGDGRTAIFAAGNQQFGLKSPFPLVPDGDGVVSDFTLDLGQTAAFVLRHREGRADPSINEAPLDAEGLLAETVRFWREWSGKSRYQGRWRETVMRSALTLKLLTYQPTGAIVAAPTTSLPEQIGGVRNWDYRYVWVRDAAFAVYGLMRLGYVEEAAAFTGFMQARAKEPETACGPLNVMYGIDGRHDLREETLDHLDGYRGSRPVRVGNAAVGHLQLDIYGELLDSLYLYDKYGSPLSYDVWLQVERMLDWVAGHWNEPDQSIWEVRGGRQEFTYSKLQCWVALDRGIRLARKRSFPSKGDTWRRERDHIYREIMTRAWNERSGAFSQYFDSETLDASVLMMPLVLFVSPKDPRILSTIARIRQELADDSLVRRYEIGKAARDGLPGGEGTFSICSFWLVEAMSRAGYLEEAQMLFEKMLSYANHLGLFAEEIGPRGELLGNFPQAFTHLGLISAAYNLNRLLG